jgi:hypothetical protein
VRHFYKTCLLVLVLLVSIPGLVRAQGCNGGGYGFASSGYGFAPQWSSTPPPIFYHSPYQLGGQPFGYVQPPYQWQPQGYGPGVSANFYNSSNFNAGGAWGGFRQPQIRGAGVAIGRFRSR